MSNEVFVPQILIRGNAGNIIVPTDVLRKLAKWNQKATLAVRCEIYPHTLYRVRTCNRGGMIVEEVQPEGDWAAIAWESWDRLCKSLPACIKCGDDLDLPNDGKYLCEGCGPERENVL